MGISPDGLTCQEGTLRHPGDISDLLTPEFVVSRKEGRRDRDWWQWKKHGVDMERPGQPKTVE